MSKRPLHIQLSAAMLRRPSPRRTTRTAALLLTVAITWHIGIGPPSANLQLLQGTNTSTRIHTTNEEEGQTKINLTHALVSQPLAIATVRPKKKSTMLKPSARNTAVNGPALPAQPGHTHVVSTRSNPTIERSTSITFNTKKAWDVQVRKNSSKLQGNQAVDCTPNIGPGPMFRPVFSPKSLPVLISKEQNGLIGPTPSSAARKP